MATRPWRLEREFLLLTALVLAVCLPRLSMLPSLGEELRWAVTAREMIDSGNYVVPTSQQVVFPDRPPLLSWSMIGAAHVVGGLTLAAVRLPSVAATLLACWLIYWYARGFLSPVGALAAGVAYPTMGVMFDYNRVGQTDALLTACVTGSLLLWHMGYVRRWHPALTWSLGYGCAALAALAKGPQGPIYFIAAVVCVLAIERDLKFLVGWGHALGAAVFGLLLGAWLVPFVGLAGWDAATRIFSENGALSSRFVFGSAWFLHLLTFPAEVFGSMLPWALVLLLLLHGPVRRRVFRPGEPQVRFLTITGAIVLASGWLVSESRPRHVMAAFPLAALMIGVVTDRTWRFDGVASIDRLRRALLGFTILVVALVAAALAACAAVPAIQPSWFASTPRFALLYVAAALVTIAFVRGAMAATIPRHASACLIALAGFIGLTYRGPVLDAYNSSRSDTPERAAAVRSLVPAGTVLVQFPSFDGSLQQFAYFYGGPIKQQPWPVGDAPVDPKLSYFCFVIEDGVVPPLPFQWRQIAVVPIGWRRKSAHDAKVVVGLREAGDRSAP